MWIETPTGLRINLAVFGTMTIGVVDDRWERIGVVVQQNPGAGPVLILADFATRLDAEDALTALWEALDHPKHNTLSWELWTDWTAAVRRHRVDATGQQALDTEGDTLDNTE